MSHGKILAKQMLSAGEGRSHYVVDVDGYSGVQRPETRSENVFSKKFCIYFSIITYFIVSKSEKSDFLYNAVHIPPHHIKC